MIRLFPHLTKIDLYQYNYYKEFPTLKGVPKWQAYRRIDAMILDIIKGFDVRLFKGKSLYSIDTAYELKKAFTLISHGIAQNRDFRPVEVGRQVSSIVDFTNTAMVFNDDFDRFYADLELQDKARKASVTEKEFRSLLHDFATYKYELLKHERVTERIYETIDYYQRGQYLGKTLFEIDNIQLLDEAIKAINLLDVLYYYGIHSYQGVPLCQQTLFMLEKCNNDYHANRLEEIVFDEKRRQHYLADMKENEEMAERRKQEEAQKKVARQHRAAKKAEIEATAKKGKPVKNKPEMKPVKAGKAAKAGTKKPVIVPIKKAAAKSSNRKSNKAS